MSEDPAEPRRAASVDPFTDAAIERLAREQYERGDAAFPLVPERTALLMIDMQEEFVTAVGGPHRVPQLAGRVPAMAGLLAAFRRQGLPVIHTAFAATHGFLDRPRLGARMPNRCRDAGFDDSSLFQTARFAPELQPLGSEVVILKPSYGAFFDTPLETILKGLARDTVVLAGILTDCCVGTTARQAYERGFGAIVVSDATATHLPEMHEAELRILRRHFARVLPVQAIVRELERQAGPAVA
jgi:nicotinamidase-related amidase